MIDVQRSAAEVSDRAAFKADATVGIELRIADAQRTVITAYGAAAVVKGADEPQSRDAHRGALHVKDTPCGKGPAEKNLRMEMPIRLAHKSQRVRDGDLATQIDDVLQFDK